eukprot:36258-Pyramimonas_sp.AAC.1
MTEKSELAARAADRRAAEVEDVVPVPDDEGDWNMPDGEVDVSGLEMWERQDYNARALKPSNRDGPNWKLVRARETFCMDTGDIIEDL